MCSLTAAIGFGLSAAQAVVGHQQQRQAAREREAAATRNAGNQRRIAAQEQAGRLAELGRRRAQASLKIQDSRKQELEARERARLASSEAGFASGAAEREIASRAAGAREAIRADHADAAQATRLGLEGAEQALRARLDATPDIRRPNPLDLGLDLAQSAFTRLKTIKR